MWIYVDAFTRARQQPSRIGRQSEKAVCLPLLPSLLPPLLTCSCCLSACPSASAAARAEPLARASPSARPSREASSMLSMRSEEAEASTTSRRCWSSSSLQHKCGGEGWNIKTKPQASTQHIGYRTYWDPAGCTRTPLAPPSPHTWPAPGACPPPCGLPRPAAPPPHAAAPPGGPVPGPAPPGAGLEPRHGWRTRTCGPGPVWGVGMACTCQHTIRGLWGGNSVLL